MQYIYKAEYILLFEEPLSAFCPIKSKKKILTASNFKGKWLDKVVFILFSLVYCCVF